MVMMICIWEDCDVEGRTPLHLASEHGRMEASTTQLANWVPTSRVLHAWKFDWTPSVIVLAITALRHGTSHIQTSPVCIASSGLRRVSGP